LIAFSAGRDKKAHIAQQVEHFLGKEEVTGSNPVVGSRFLKRGFFCSEK
jgi:hypothetical protein